MKFSFSLVFLPLRYACSCARYPESLRGKIFEMLQATLWHLSATFGNIIRNLSKTMKANFELRQSLQKAWRHQRIILPSLTAFIYAAAQHLSINWTIEGRHRWICRLFSFFAQPVFTGDWIGIKRFFVQKLHFKGCQGSCIIIIFIAPCNMTLNQTWMKFCSIVC